MKTTLLLSTIVVGTLGIVTAQAEMYRYVDESGQVIYSQFKPDNTDQISTVKPPPPPPSTAAESRQQLNDTLGREQDARQDAEKQAEADEKSQQEIERNRKNCEAARNNLKVLQDGSGYQRIMKDGKEVKFDDSQRQAEIRKAQDMIQKSCN